MVVNVRASHLSMWIVRGTCALMVIVMVITMFYSTNNVKNEREFPIDEYYREKDSSMVLSSDETPDPRSADKAGQGQKTQDARSKISIVAMEKTDEEFNDNNFLSKSDTAKSETASPTDQHTQKLPSALIVGARKAGTRALAKFLNLHPQIVTLGHEVQYFNNLDNYNKGDEWYRSQMPRVKSDQIVIEKSAEYFHTMEVPERVYNMNPDMKIIVVLRDPFDRMVSDYMFLKRYAKQYNSSYHFAEEDHTLEDLIINKTTGKMKYTHGGLHRSEYHKFVANWLKFFPMEQIIILNGDRFAKENPAEQLQKVEEFLDLRPYLRHSLFYFDTKKGFYCLQDGGCLSEEKGHEHPVYPEWFEKKVRNHFYYKNRLLYDLTGEDMGWK